MKKSVLAVATAFCLAVGSVASAATLTLDARYALDPTLSDPKSNFAPQGLGYDPVARELLFAQQSTNAIYRTDLMGGLLGSRTIGQIVYTPRDNYTPIANHTTSVASDGTRYFFSDYTANRGGFDLYMMDKSAGPAVAASSEIAGYGGYPIDVRNGNLYRTNTSNQYHYGNLNQLRISSLADIDGPTTTLNLIGAIGIGDIAVDTGSNSLFTIDYLTSAAIRRFDLETGLLLDTYDLGLDGLSAGITYAEGKLYHYDWVSDKGSLLSVYDVDYGTGITPVPLPASSLLLLGALGGLAALVRRKKA